MICNLSLIFCVAWKKRSKLIGFHLPYPGHGMVERKDGAYRFVAV